jgi:hypothetical protein
MPRKGSSSTFPRSTAKALNELRVVERALKAERPE